MNTKWIGDLIKKGLKEDKKFRIWGVGTLELLPARKGKFYNMHTGEWTDKTSRKWRVKFTPTHAFKEWLKEI